jgi:hypothetical protein
VPGFHLRFFCPGSRELPDFVLMLLPPILLPIDLEAMLLEAMLLEAILLEAILLDEIVLPIPCATGGRAGMSNFQVFGTKKRAGVFWVKNA